MDCSGAPRPAGWSSATSRRRPRRKPANRSRAPWPSPRRPEMRATAARRLEWMAVRPTRQPEPEPDNLAACLSSPGGLELVVEMAHDLRSPLTSILFLAEALQRGQSGPVTDAQRRALGLVYSAALSLCGAASDVLELAQGGNRLVDRRPEPFSVSEVFASVRDMILPLAEEKRLEVRLVHPVPERRIGHPRALSRVLLNLATNAVKFTDAGSVEIAARPLDRNRLEFSVCDTGSGYDTSALQTLYQPFRKSPSDLRHHFSSAGLGLAICRKLVKAMGAALPLSPTPRAARTHRPRAAQPALPQHRRGDRGDRPHAARDARHRRADQADVARPGALHPSAGRARPARPVACGRQHAPPGRSRRQAVHNVQVPHDARGLKQRWPTGVGPG